MEHLNISIEDTLAVVAVLLLGSVLVSKISDRFGVPALLLFLGIGMLAGSDGPGGIQFDNYALAEAVGIIALAFILFSGGLDTSWESVRPVLWQGLSLATVGTLLTAVLAAAFAWLVFGIPWTTGLLLGAIVSPTDAAAVLAVFSGTGIKLKGRLQALIEWESGTNDPMAVFLTLGAIDLLTQPSTTAASLVLRFALQMLAGALAGYVLGRVAVVLINHIRLGFDGLYPVLTVALTLLAYGGTAVIGGSGFLAVYVAGMVLGNHVFVHKRSLLRFHDGTAWLMQVAMFLILGLLVFPHQLVPVAGVGLLFAVFLILVARPASVFIALAPVRYSWQSKAFVSWAGLRGAVPIILATYPLLAGVERAGTLFNVVFFVVLVSALVQGTTIKSVARRLGLEAPPEKDELLPGAEEQADLMNGLREMEIPANASVEGRALVELDIPQGFLVVAVQRDGERFIPNGQTVLRARDNLLVLGDEEQIQQVKPRLMQTESER